MKPAGADDGWLVKALAAVAAARGKAEDPTTEGFIDSLTADEVAFCVWVSVRHRLPTGCLVRTCQESSGCVNPDHHEDLG